MTGKWIWRYDHINNGHQKNNICIMNQACSVKMEPNEVVVYIKAKRTTPISTTLTEHYWLQEIFCMANRLHKVLQWIFEGF